MPRRHRSNSKLQKRSSSRVGRSSLQLQERRSGGADLFTQEEEFAPLPESVDACTRELGVLTERQRAITTRVKRVTAQLRQLLLQGRVDHTETANAFESEDAGSTKAINRVVLENKTTTIKHDISEDGEAGQKTQSEGEEDDDQGSGVGEDIDQSSPLICALKKLQRRTGQKRCTKLWTYNLANLFFIADADGSGYIDAVEYTRMIDKLDLSDTLKDALRGKFSSVDSDDSGAISLEEFLLFFLQFPLFKRELFVHSNKNAPYVYESSLTCRQKWRQWLYCIVELPGYNNVSKLLFCIDAGLTLVPIVILCIEGVRPSINIEWCEDTFMWIASIFFAFEYLCGLLTCKFKKKFIFDVSHILELVSFLFWIIYNTFGRAVRLEPMGFVVFRAVRFVKVHMVFKLETLKEDLDIYIETLKLAYTSYGAVSMLLLFTIIFFSLLIYVFERGEFNESEKRWERNVDEGESPFSSIYDCIYFTVVTMTTLGYGDRSAKSYVGMLISMICVLVGLCNITFLINIVGDCFEEVFREFVLKRSEKMELEHSKYLMDCVERMSTQFELKSRSKTSCWRLSSDNRLKRHKRVLAAANIEQTQTC